MCASVPFTRYDDDKDDNTDQQVFGQVDGGQGDEGDDDDSPAKCVCLLQGGRHQTLPIWQLLLPATPAPPLYHLDLSACTH